MITVVGEALVDLVRPAGAEPAAYPGGSPANVAVGLARLGADVALVTRFGRDDYGHLIADHLYANGVGLLGDPLTHAPTSVAEARLDASGAATYEFRLTWDLDEGGGHGDPELAEGSVCLHTGSIAATLEPGGTTVRRMVEKARGQATTSYDPNCRPTLMGTPAQARTLIESTVASSDVVKVSDEDLAWLYGDRPLADVGAEWLELGPALVVVTRGEQGAWGINRAGTTERPPVRVTVADTVGAGDAFTAGLLNSLRRHHLLGGEAAEALRGMDVDLLNEVIGEAAVVAAITVSRPGADPPTAEDVAAFGR